MAAHRRLSLTVRVRVVWDSGEITGYSTDVSSSGLFVETVQALPAGTNVRVEFSVTQQMGLTRIVAEGLVERCLRAGGDVDSSPLSGMGIRLDRFLFGGETLDHYVNQHLRAVSATAARLADDRRRAPRVTVGFPLFWGPDDPPQREGFLSDLSATGCFIVGAAEPVGTALHLWFELPISGRSVPIRALARVARVIPADGDLPAAMGLHFEPSSMDVEAFATISGFVDTRLAWLRLIESLPGGERGWPVFADADTELPPPAPEVAPSARELDPSGLRPKVIYRMLMGTLSVMLLILAFVVIIYLKITCASQ